ncbi:hypothetical protein CTAYLR_000281 [Chrysophaeum taylorii]|uniref:Uncharacterized protein n=1 Tax=Chrysophaeum taylorii TaxID=2483200 RepID=A0AAD7UE63_9STRA|nr:hypothetical protein CTAYLR_000281 [Chrysophaeum taylorii]
MILFVVVVLGLVGRCRGWHAPALPRSALKPLLSESKQLPDQPGVTDSMPITPPNAEDYDDLADIRERIRRRAEELNLEANVAPAPEVYDKAGPKNVLQEIMDDAVEQAEIEELAEEYSDGLSLWEGALKELKLIEWPTLQDSLLNLAIVVAITTFMVGYVWFIDWASKSALSPLYPWLNE